MESASSARARAAVTKPASRRRATPSHAQSRALPMRAQGTWNTVPMETRDARRNSGSWQAGVSSTASMPRAAALRKMAPMLV